MRASNRTRSGAGHPAADAIHELYWPRLEAVARGLGAEPRRCEAGAIPAALHVLAAETVPPGHVVLAAPGDGGPADGGLEVWRIRRGPPLGTVELRTTMRELADPLLPARRRRLVDGPHPHPHPHVHAGLRLDVEHEGAWVEVGTGGLARPALLREAGLDGHRWSALVVELHPGRVSAAGSGSG